jgi:hypothetical protein
MYVCVSTSVPLDERLLRSKVSSFERGALNRQLDDESMLDGQLDDKSVTGELY